MHARPSNLVRPTVAARAEDWPAPPWAAALVAQAGRRPDADGGPLSVTVAASGEASLVTARVREADALPPADFERATALAYAAIARELGRLAAGEPVRFWNYIPGIHRHSGESPDGRPLDRYMVFNAGRYAACSRWLGGEDAFPRGLATASGVGHADADLVIHALAVRRPGVAVENPRQVPAYRYSGRYGPRPPCFARATIVRWPTTGRPATLVGGTASVRGEASVHVGDLQAQMAETAQNLAALLGAAASTAYGHAASAAPPTLDALTDVRAYYVRPTDLDDLRVMCGQAFPAAALEFVRADLCRQDLLVEIEGVATLD